jgi:hypothetical protein
VEELTDMANSPIHNIIEINPSMSGNTATLVLP